MLTRREFLALAALPPPRTGLDPRGRVHIALGVPGALETLQTYVASYGVYFWLGNLAGEIVAPTMPAVAAEHGLSFDGLLIPWIRWSYWDAEVTQRICQVAGDPQLVAVRVSVRRAARLRLLAAVRPIGPAGWDIANMQADVDALLVGGHPALLAFQKPSWIGTGAVDLEASRERFASSPSGDCWGLLEFELNGSRDLDFVCPVLAGRRAAFDRRAEQNPLEGGVPQRDPGLSEFRKLSVPKLFDRARRDAGKLAGRFEVDLPDPRWRECLRAMVGHAALASGAGAPVINVLQKAGCFELAENALENLLAHPDNPGELLWCLAEHWRFTRNRGWVRRIYPRARPLAELHPGPDAATLAEAAGDTARAARYRRFAGPPPGPRLARRKAAWAALSAQLELESMRGWYALGGPGQWPRLRSTWTPNVAMPYGPAIAEFWLAMRDSLVYEDGDKLVLFAGVPESWFGGEFGFRNLRTWWGPCTARWRGGKAHIEGAKPPGGFVVTAPRARASHGRGMLCNRG